MNTEQLAYVRKALTEGRSREEITSSLRQHGYAEDHITELFKAAESSEVTGTAVVPPAPPVGAVPLPSISVLLSGIMAAIKQRWDLVLIMAAVSWVGSALGLALELSEDEPQTGLIMFPLLLLLFVVSFVVYLGAMRNFLHVEEKISTSLQWAMQNFFSLLWVAILSTLAIFAGLPFFIIPTIIVAGYLFLAQLVRIEEGVKGINALVRSTTLVQGNWWALMWRFVVLMILMFVVAMLLSFVGGVLYAILTGIGVTGGGSAPDLLVGILVNIPVSLLSSLTTLATFSALVQLYRALASQKPAFVAEAHPRLRTLYIVLAALGPIMFVLALGLLFGGLIFGAVALGGLAV